MLQISSTGDDTTTCAGRMVLWQVLSEGIGPLAPSVAEAIGQMANRLDTATG